MNRFYPSPAEASVLHFLLPVKVLWTRFFIAGALFAVGVSLWVLAPAPEPRGLGLVIAALGHLPLWVRRQTNAPGGATPLHEEAWAPTEDDWMTRVTELERQGEDWDTSLWDVTCVRGFLTLLLVVLGFGTVALILASSRLGFDAAVLFVGAAAVLLLPVWFNGIRTTWNPSELRKKGEALDAARLALARTEADDFDQVPMLALREGRRGKYPVDARLMLRPASDDGSGFLGIQVQVSMNNVQGTDYPYLYCVVLGKRGFRVPDPQLRHWRQELGTRLVFERDDGPDVSFQVIRQHADKQGGWHTKERNIRDIITAALEEGRRAWDANRPGKDG